MNIEEPVPPLPDSAWFKSSYSSGEGGQCIEVATSPGTIHVRDSKARTGPMLAFAPGNWATFVGFATRD
ncbi:DUF397 domain-containing protein [Streptomyces sp. BE133]|uniref:DUF397 domain-containing protein n=1 Tax=Streptomyces sp. BE133 TaxID=3002523 RepID=UPI002E76ECEC|nr:DUF397 domain-containing protein [Streptomyces sp. BE133]MEE1810373.1 DUF397 domain-containing protein [Streptomyces sp. BE133]